MTGIKTLKKWLMIIFLLVFSLVLFADAEIKFKEKEIDFGEIESGETIEVKFEFENVGDKPLIIKNVSTSCGCTATRLEKREFQPGERGEIPAKFFSRGYSGRIIKTVTVTTNDKKNKHTILKIAGEVKLTKFALIELSPDKIDFETINLGEKFTRQITLKNPGTIDLRIIELIHAPELSPEFTEKIIPAGKESTVNIVFTPMEPGKFSSFFKIRTTAYRRPMSLVRISANVAGEETDDEPKNSDVKDDRL